MWVFLFFLIISQAGFSYFLFTKIKQLQKEKEVKTNPGDIVLPKLKEMPKIEDIDTDSKLLQDIIESAKLENWKPVITAEFHTYRKTWRFEICNPQNTIRIVSVLRISNTIGHWSNKGNDIDIGYFNVTSSGVGVSFEKENKFQNYLIIEYLWGFILEENQKSYDHTWKHYVEAKEIIEDKLTTLKRDRQLKKLFEQNLEN